MAFKKESIINLLVFTLFSYTLIYYKTANVEVALLYLKRFRQSALTSIEELRLPPLKWAFSRSLFSLNQIISSLF